MMKVLKSQHHLLCTLTCFYSFLDTTLIHSFGTLLSTMDTIRVGRSLAVAVYDVKARNFPKIYWVEGVVTSVDEGNKVKMFIEADDADNDFVWDLSAVEMASDENDICVDDMTASIRNNMRFFKWRMTTSKTPSPMTYLRSITRDETIEMILTWMPHRNHERDMFNKYSSAKLSSMFLMAEAYNPASEHAPKETAPKAKASRATAPKETAPKETAPEETKAKAKAKVTTAKATVTKANEAGPSKRALSTTDTDDTGDANDPRVHIFHKKLRSDGGDGGVGAMMSEKRMEVMFKTYLNPYWAEVKSMKTMMTAMDSKMSIMEAKLASRMSAPVVTTTKTGNSLADSLSVFKKNINTVAMAKKYNIDPKMMTNISFNKGDKSTTTYRCKRLINKAIGLNEPSCVSKEMVTTKDNGPVWHSSAATQYPACVMEIRPEIVGKTLKEAHTMWGEECVCPQCAVCITGNNRDIKFISRGKVGLPKDLIIPPQELRKFMWKTCVFCYDNTANISDKIPTCASCHTAINKDGGIAGGDNRARHMVLVSVRFPSIKSWKMTWPEYLADHNTDAAKVARQHKNGPDSVMTFDVAGLKGSVLMEEDARMHANETAQAEALRMVHCTDVPLQKPEGMCLMFRYPPKETFKSATGTTYTPEKSTRLLIIRSWITWWIKMIHQGEIKMPRLVIVYLCYNHNHEKFKEAEKIFASRDAVVVQTHTTPQDYVWNDAYDWRYALTPNEGFIYAMLADDYKTTGILKTTVQEIIPSLFQKDANDEEEEDDV